MNMYPINSARIMVIHNNFRIDRMIDASFKFLPYQLWMVGYWPTMAFTGNGELGLSLSERSWKLERFNGLDTQP